MVIAVIYFLLIFNACFKNLYLLEIIEQYKCMSCTNLSNILKGN